MDNTLTSITGWSMMVLLITIILYPFLLRAGILGPIQPFLRRMRLHYWMAYSLALLLVVHLWVSMTGMLALVVNTLGLYLATIAMFLVLAQILLGLRLRQPSLIQRRLIRRQHFWVMLALVAFVIGHVVLDSPAIRLLTAR
jgi:hypothetical protein